MRCEAPRVPAAGSSYLYACACACGASRCCRGCGLYVIGRWGGGKVGGLGVKRLRFYVKSKNINNTCLLGPVHGTHAHVDEDPVCGAGIEVSTYDTLGTTTDSF